MCPFTNVSATIQDIRRHVCRKSFIVTWRTIQGRFIKKLKLKEGSVPIVRDQDALPEVVSLTLYSIYFFFYDYLLITFALPLKRGAGWAVLISI